MSLTDLEKNSLNEAFLKMYRQRLTGKDQAVLPDEGVTIDLIPPTAKNLLGSIGPMPNPDYGGIQPPNYIGMVLLVTPDADQNINCSISGRFDICHRQIPDIDFMKREIAYEKGQPRAIQKIAQSFRRFTVPFENVKLFFHVPNDLSKWVRSDVVKKDYLDPLKSTLAADPRLYKSCRLYPNGKALINFRYPDILETQSDLNGVIINEIFAPGATEALSYEVEVRGRLRMAPQSLTKVPGAMLLELSLINLTSSEVGQTFGMERPFLLDCRMETQIASGSQHLLPHKLKPEDYRLYEGDGLHGYGINCAVEKDAAGKLYTDCMPIVKQPMFEAPLPADVGMNVAPSFENLAKAPLPILDSLIAALRNYDKKWLVLIDEMDQSGLAHEAAVARREEKEFKAEVERVQGGYDLLTANADLLKCFQWMNEAMKAGVERQGKSFKGWRLFQLGFIMTQIEAVYERFDGMEPETPSWDRADILWFATGGGKTEAYLGLICMAMLYGRLKGREYGTTAWLRFPLRMLSVQQFQRLSYVVAQANVLRQIHSLGGHPFTIGYFTGSGTPSQISSTFDHNKNTFLPTMSDEVLNNLKFISDCPYCDEKHSVEMKRDLPGVRIKHVCKNPECWSNTHAEPGAHGEGIRGEIGIYVSDEECYRYLPTVIVGTVDKLAVIAHNTRFSKFFGSASHYCPVHGFSATAKCEHYKFGKDDAGNAFSVRCENNSKNSAVRTVKLAPMLDPGFQFGIQDELHLLKELLGNFNGHYETLLQALQEGHGGHPPKILAATATIKDYEHQIRHIYQKDAVRYPAPGIAKGESFYSRKKDATRRYFASLLPITQHRYPMRAVSDASSRYLDLIDDLRKGFAADKVKAAADLSLAPVKADDALAHIETQLNTNLIYVNKKRSISEIKSYLEEENLNRTRERFSTRLDAESTLDEIQAAIEHISTKGPDDPLRQIIATSIVSHGVDIERLNFMILAGCPTSTAEYIQASARSGRVHPGIILTMLSYRNLYEHNVFLNFADYHIFMDKMVESVPINRFAPNVLERTLPGVLAAVILNWASCQSWGISTRGRMSDIHKMLNEAGSPARLEIERVALTALQVDAVKTKHWFDGRVVDEFTTLLKKEVQRGLNRLETWSGSQLDMFLGEALQRIYGHAPFRSFRDIEKQAGVLPARAHDEIIFDALRR